MSLPHPSPIHAPAGPAGASASRHDTWRRHARLWSLVTSPLRPSPGDAAAYRAAIEEWMDAEGRSDPDVLLLGVTPEVCTLPVGGRVIAVDKSEDMIGAVWPGRIRDHDAVVRADWRSLPLAPGSVDLVVGDGALCPLAYPADHAPVCAELRAVLREGGRWVVRCFARPEESETIADIRADLERGKIGNVQVLKWRLAMALQPDVAQGVVAQDVWSAFHAEWPDLDLLAERQGWPPDEVRCMEAYRGNRARYTFPTFAEHVASLAAGGFDVARVTTGEYELAERCPILTLVPRGEEGRGR